MRLAIASVAIEATAAGVWLAWRSSRWLRASWAARVAVAGDSMAPTLASGDWLLVDPMAFRDRAPRVDELVLVPDPRAADRLLVKRVKRVDGPRLWVAGDAPGASTDSRDFGALEGAAVVGRPWFRYWPPERWGRVG